MHPAIIVGLKQSLFETPSSFGWKHIDLCKSSLKEKPDEQELPMAMLAFISTVVRGSSFSVLVVGMLSSPLLSNLIAGVLCPRRLVYRRIQEV